MKNFVQRAIQKIDQLDTNQIVEILKNQSSDLEMLESVLESIQDGGVILTDERKIVHYANSRCRTSFPWQEYGITKEWHSPGLLRTNMSFTILCWHSRESIRMRKTSSRSRREPRCRPSQ